MLVLKRYRRRRNLKQNITLNFILDHQHIQMFPVVLHIIIIIVCVINYYYLLLLKLFIIIYYYISSHTLGPPPQGTHFFTTKIKKILSVRKVRLFLK